MNIKLTKDQKVLLEAISRYRTDANWYQLGRTILGQLEHPGKMDNSLRVLKELGLIVERTTGEPLPILEVTSSGWALIESWDIASRDSK